MVPKEDCRYRYAIKNDADDEVDTEREFMVFDHCIACQRAKDGPWESDEIKNSLRMSSMLVRNKFSNGCKTESKSATPL
jgi:hypothetical protein